MTADLDHDVVIGGGGLAGLTLARHLARKVPGLRVAVVERSSRPLPDAAHKVGESTVAVGGYYLQEILGLHGYLEQNHVLKLGLRYFFQPSNGPFEARPELGPSRLRQFNLGPYPVPEWQLDRGRFESDLRGLVSREPGTVLLEGTRLVDVELGDPTRVVVEPEQAGAGGQGRRALRCRWFVNATGRRSFLRRKLDLPLQQQTSHSACWFRVKGRIDVGGWVPRSRSEWHGRVPGGHPTDPTFGRYNSTTHLMGHGYWVWLIPLSTGHTSVGIVARDDLQPVAEIAGLEQAMEWLRANEPTLHRHLDGQPVIDFKRLRHYSHICEQVLSADRWALTGEAGCFIDPFYSPGTDAIAFMNSVICQVIRLDRLGKLSPEVAARLGSDYVEWCKLATAGIQSGYPLFGCPTVGSLKIMWDFAVSMAISSSTFFDLRLRDDFLARHARLAGSRTGELRTRVGALSVSVARLLGAWRARGPSTLTFDFLEMLDDNPVTRGELPAPVGDDEDLVERWFGGLEQLREFAVAIFLLAIRDLEPSHLASLLEAPRIAPESLELRPETWAGCGLFGAEGVPRDRFLPVFERLSPLYRRITPAAATTRPVQEAEGKL